MPREARAGAPAAASERRSVHDLRGWSPPTSTARSCAPTRRCRSAPATCWRGSRTAGALFVMVTGRPPRWMAQVARGDRPPRPRGLRQRRARLRPAHRARGAGLPDRRPDGAAARRGAARATCRASPSRSRRASTASAASRRTSRAGTTASVVVAPVEELVAARRRQAARPASRARRPTTCSPRRARSSASSPSAPTPPATGWSRSARPGSPRRPGSPSSPSEWGIDAADVIAFGDMPNDLPMLALGRPVRRAWATPTPTSSPPPTR